MQQVPGEVLGPAFDETGTLPARKRCAFVRLDVPDQVQFFADTPHPLHVNDDAVLLRFAAVSPTEVFKHAAFVVN